MQTNSRVASSTSQRTSVGGWVGSAVRVRSGPPLVSYKLKPHDVRRILRLLETPNVLSHEMLVRSVMALA